MLRRVVVTGVGAVSALGNNWAEIKAAFLQYQNAVVVMNEWDRFEQMNTRLAAPILNYQKPAHWTRKQARSLGRVSMLAVDAAERALLDAGLLDDPRIQDGRMGVACGSSTGSTDDIKDVVKLLLEGTSPNFSANTYIRMMPHTTAANISIFFGLKGRMIPTSCACASGSQAIGYAYEAIKYGLIDMMVAGGADELCPSEAYVFDSLYATSTRNDTPKLTPQPYDSNRDGLVIGEGAGMLVLEEYEQARARNATIYAEIVGFGSNSDGFHVTQPQKDTMAKCMELALKDNNIDKKEVAYVNGHGTATEQGDIAETLATEQVFGSNVAISSQKSYLGHTLGACGALESWFSIQMMNEKLFMPTINLANIDERCGQLNYLFNQAKVIDTEYVVNNNFAFGGVNTSLVFKKLD